MRVSAAMRFHIVHYKTVYFLFCIAPQSLPVYFAEADIQGVLLRPLTYDEIDKIWQEKADLEPKEVPELIENMGNKQPYVLSYLLATGNEILVPSEREVVFFMGVLIWYVIDSLKIKLDEIPIEQLLENEEKNYEMLEYLAGEPDSEFMETVSKIMEHYNQSVFLRYIIEQIMNEPKKEIEIIENHIGMMVIYLKTFIDCIDSLI